MMGIAFDGIASKFHFKNMTDFNLTKQQHMIIFQVWKINIDGYILLFV